jgi:DNA-binding XRE family transcriptional regulator
MYNYAIHGPNEKRISNLKQSTAWGNDSVLSYLVKNNTCGLAININPKIFNWLVIHYCEETSKVPYRYFKTFNGKNTSTRKNVQERMYVRNYSLNKIEDGRKINNILLKKKIIKKFKFDLFDIYFLPFDKYNDIALSKLKKINIILSKMKSKTLEALIKLFPRFKKKNYQNIR